MKSKRSRTDFQDISTFDPDFYESSSQKTRKVYEEFGEDDSSLFANMPAEILFHIISWVPFGSRFSTALVCRRWKRLSDAQVDFFCNLKFMSFATFKRPDLWSRVMDDRGAIMVPSHLATPTLYQQVARYVRDTLVVHGFISHPSFKSIGDDTIRTMVHGSIKEDNSFSLRVMLKFRKFREHIMTEAFVLACERYDKHPGKTMCLATIIKSGAADMFLVVYQIVQLLIDQKRHLAIEKLSGCESFYRDAFCCLLYANYALREGKQDLLIKILTKSTLDVAVDDNFILKGACTRGWFRVVRILLLKGIDPSVDDQESLQRACLSNNKDLIKLLLSHPNVRPGDNGNAVIQYALLHKKDEAASFMINHPSVNLAAHDNEDQSLLCLAAKYMCYKSMKAILNSENVDPNQYNHYPTRMCVVNRFVRGIRLLVKHPALKLTYSEATHVLSMANFISDTKLRETVLKDKRFSDAFEIMVPNSEDDMDELHEVGHFVIRNDQRAMEL